MASIAREWDFLYQPTLGGSKGVLLSDNKQVAFPTHYWMKEAFIRIGKPEAFFKYRDSRLGRSTHTGKENAHIESGSYQYTILSAESVARGWLYDPVIWEDIFTTERTRSENLFLRVEGYSNRGMLELVNAAMLWDYSQNLPYECEDAFRFALFNKEDTDHYVHWVKWATRASLTPHIVLEAAERIVLRQNVEGILSTIVRMILFAEEKASLKLSRADFAAWMFIFADVAEDAETQELDFQIFINDVIALNPLTEDFQSLCSSEIPLATIPYALGAHIDSHLFGALR